jgi:hypothetical protein
MLNDARTQPILFTDATNVKMQSTRRCRTAYFFTLIAPEKHMLFSFSTKHNNAAIDELLADFRGYLVADAHTIFDHLFLGDQVWEVGCWAHARRYFIRSASSEPDRSIHALNSINRLFALDAECRGKPPDERLKFRQANSKPILDRLLEWCQKQYGLVFETSPIHKALQYVLN